MPAPNTKGALRVTASDYEAPFTTPTFRPGHRGLNLRKTIDALETGELSRMQNVTWNREGQLTSRSGLVIEATTGGTKVHSVRRLANPLSGTATRVWGIDTSVYVGLQGALSSADSGYSGNPLSIVPHRPPLSGESWAYIADASRMRKVRGDGLSLEIGLAAPTAVCTTALGTERTTYIAQFGVADGSDAPAWVAHQGSALEAPLVETPSGAPSSNSDHVYFTLFGGGEAAYHSFFALTRTIDLSKVGTTAGGEVTSEDDDHIHFWFKFSKPTDATEVRIYFVLSNWNDAATELPGTEEGVNDQFFVKTIRPGDLAAFFNADETAEAGITDAASRTADEDLLSQIDIEQGSLLKEFETSFTEDGQRFPYKPQVPRTVPTRRQVSQVGLRGPSGSQEWVEFGVGGNPLRKSDFTRHGMDTTVDWADVKGIVIYVGCQPDAGISVGFDDMYLTGGSGPDNSEVGAAGYDHRVTNFDTRTGAESNPSPIMSDSNALFALRRAITITPAAAYGDSAIRQRAYRRGGILGDNWYFLGENTSDGGAITDTYSDAELATADTVEIDHQQPVQTVDRDGTIIKAQPIKAMWGPIQDILFGCGDPYRPGHLYWCIPGEPDHWSAFNTFEVCSPSEELMNGGYYGGQGFVFSRQRMYWFYPNLTGDGSISVTPSSCAKGLFSRWALAVGSTGIYFVNRDGVWKTTGGEPQLLSADLGDEDDGGIFSGSSINGYSPIDWSAVADLQLEIWGTELWFLYRDTGGTNRHLIYDLMGQRWKWYTWGVEPGTMFSDAQTPDEAARMVIGGRANGDAYEHRGTSDAGAAISASFRTGSLDGDRGREDKLMGDLFVDMDRDLANITVTTYLNDEVITNTAQTITSGTSRLRYVLDSFGTTPQRARSVAVQMAWSSATRQPKVEQLGFSVIQEPESTNLRATQWDDCGSSNEKWLFGVMIECDTYGVDRDIIIEYMQGTTVATAHTETINHSGRRRVFLDWDFVRADRVRIRPVTDCANWILYECDWIFHDQPPRIGRMDSGEEGPWDTYYTGLDLDINTFNVAKTFNVYVDGSLVTNPVTGTNDFSVTANGRQVVHLTFGPGRGHIYRFVATDDNTGLLYNHRWHLDEEPSEQANWNQNFSILGTHTDKWIKGVKLECDTFGVNKTVTIEVDGTVAATLTVNTSDRRVVHEAFPQVRGRVVRILPTDTNPGRLYSASLIFDEEPLGLDRWETQELNLGSTGWKALLEGWITLRSSASVTLTVTHVREDGSTTDRTYTLPNTSGVKAPYYLTFEADKSVLFKFTFTSAADFWLYRQESRLIVADWAGGQREVQPFGDDDLDKVRGMATAEGIAAAGGGGS